MFTTHGIQRAKERAGIGDSETMDRLWAAGRDASNKDLLMFGTNRRPGAAYRVAIRQGNMFLLIRCIGGGPFITVIKRKTK